jgi:hypothetical protein
VRDRMAGPETGLFFLHNAQHRALAYEGGGLAGRPLSVQRERALHTTSATGNQRYSTTYLRNNQKYRTTKNHRQ